MPFLAKNRCIPIGTGLFARNPLPASFIPAAPALTFSGPIISPPYYHHHLPKPG
jgi:hypothetical protein